MKKIFTLFFALCAISVWAHDFSVNGIYYNYLEGNEVEVTYRGADYFEYNDEYSGSVTIPSTVTYKGTTYNVTKIGNTAFYACYSLTSVVISEGVRTLGE